MDAADLATPRRERDLYLRLLGLGGGGELAAVAERKRREDLFYRLEVMPIRVPSLAERQSDVAGLAAHFVRSACDRKGFAALELSSAAARAIHAAEWPGNVRQLAHATEAATIRRNDQSRLAA